MPLLPKEQDILPETIFELNDPWFVAHVRSRQEKVLARYLAQRHVAYFLPQIEKSATRDGRRRTSHVPLFPGYLFFRGGSGAKQAALHSNVVANLIAVEDQPLLTEELRQIRQLQVAGASLVPVEEFVAGDAVRITEGAFAGYHGTVIRGGRADRLLVSVSLLRKAVAVEFPRETLKRRRA